MHVLRGLPLWPAAPKLVDRRIEREALDELLVAVKGGDSRALILYGEPGIGKTALLDYLTSVAEGCSVVRTSGVQSEMALAFAGLHQLCGSMLDRLALLPGPQGRALEVAFGLREGTPPDPFLIGLAVLGLLSEQAQRRPLLCLIDDFQWMDFSSAQILAFVARRLGSEAVGVVFATRNHLEDLGGLPSVRVEGLRPTDARELLDSVVPHGLDGRIRDQIVIETGGNPLALLELPKALTPLDRVVAFELPGAVPLTGSIEESFLRRIAALPEQTRRLLLVAAAEPTGDTALVRRAAATLGVETEAATPAAGQQLAEFEPRLRFRHPLVRSAIYGSATAEDRRRVHAALAEVMDPVADAERRSWHRAHAAAGPDEDIARDLEHSGELAKARGCLATAGAYLKEAVALSADPHKRAQRAVSAAEGSIRAGALDDAVELLAVADGGPLDDLHKAHADLVRAQLSYVTNRGNDAPGLLMKAASELQRADPQLARATYLDALSAAIFAGRLASPGGSVVDVARAVADAPRPNRQPSAPDLLLEGLVASYNHGYGSGVELMRQALAIFDSSPPVPDQMHWMFLASITAMRVWDDKLLDSLSERHVQLARETCSLSELPMALTTRSFALLFAGNFSEANACAEEALTAMTATGSTLAPYGAFAVAALKGDTKKALDLIEETLKDVTRRGEGAGFPIAEWANAALHNGLRRYGEALAAARRASSYEPDPGSTIWSLVELVEAAARVDEVDLATQAYERLKVMTSGSGTSWALGLEKRSAALLASGDQAEHLYYESIDHLGQTRQRLDLARAHLVYGEWLRRQRRRLDAREQLRTALDMFETMGAAAFAERASHELKAAGDPTRRVLTNKMSQLTPQETQIARMARDGLSNPEIGTRLFISTHTVQFHLKKVFGKLGISSRHELERALPPDPDSALLGLSPQRDF